jgi:HEAT repeat protein
MRALAVSVTTLVCLALSARAADVSQLLKQLKSTDADNRRSAAKALGQLGADSKAAVPALTAALKDRDVFVRRFAAQSLGAIGTEARSAIPALKQSLNDPRMEVQTAAADALGKMGVGGIDALLAIVKNTNADATQRSRAIAALRDIGPPAHTAVEPLLAIVTGSPPGPSGKRNMDVNLRVDALAALGAIANASDQKVLDTLTGLMDKKEKNRAVRMTARTSMQQIRKRKE